uniref:Uncharacterized protein n=1 Tax=Parascaris univalens TaxID=6257 RepID=A0A914ZTH7_PARUN
SKSASSRLVDRSSKHYALLVRTFIIANPNALLPFGFKQAIKLPLSRSSMAILRGEQLVEASSEDFVHVEFCGTSFGVGSIRERVRSRIDPEKSYSIDRCLIISGLPKARCYCTLIHFVWRGSCDLFYMNGYTHKIKKCSAQLS